MSPVYDVIVIGGGQAGIAAGHHLARLGLQFLILDAGERVGDAWRHRWDSLHLFTPAVVDGMPGEHFPAPRWSFPSHTEFADYLEEYVGRTGLPVRLRSRVRRLSRADRLFAVETQDEVLSARSVVVATGHDAVPRIPPFAGALGDDVAQFTAASYRNPAQVPDGVVLLVGAGNSGAEIALDLAGTHTVYLAGRHPGQLPFRIGSPIGRPLGRLAFWAFGHVLTVGTPMGRRARPALLAHSGPLIRTRSQDLAAAGVTRVGRVVGVSAGQPVLAEGDLPRVQTVIWCAGFDPDDSWIELPVLAADGAVRHQRGAADDVPGLYFLGRLFQYSLASSMIHGVQRDAAEIAGMAAAFVRAAKTLPAAAEDGQARPLNPGQPFSR